MSSVNDIPNGWVETNLGKLGRVITGKTPSKNNPKDWGNDFDFITPSEIDNSSKYIFNTPRKLSQQGFDRFSRMILPANSVIVTCIGSDMGKVVMNKNQALTNQQINSIAIGDEYNNDYVFYLLKNAYRILRRNAEGSGSTMPILNKSSFESLTFVIPEDIKEQKAIANILTAFDDKIENLQAQNRTLEQTAQTIFKEWFGKYQVGNELPDGWRIGKLGEISKLKSGYAFKSKDFVENSSFKALKIKDLKGNGDVSISEVSSIDEECTQIDRVQYFRLKQGDIVLAMSGNTTGKIGVIPPHSNEIYLNQRVGKFFLNNEKQKSFLYNFLMSGNFEDKILSMGYGSAQPNISPSQIESIDIIFPDNEKQIEYLNISNPIYDKVLMNNSQIQSLIKTRDTLLPKLMSGKLRVNEFII